jgi:hypothetical protein
VAIRTSEQALAAIKRDAAARALAYIEREIPATLEAITFWVSEGKSEGSIMAEIESAYDITEERVQHKLRLVVEAAIRDRED